MNISDHFIPEPSEDDLAYDFYQQLLEQEEQDEQFIRSNASHANAESDQYCHF